MKSGFKQNQMRMPKYMILVWVQGWINGRTGTAGISSEGEIKSGFILQLTNKYIAYTAKEMSRLDTVIHELTAEAEKILLNLEDCDKQQVTDTKPVKIECTTLVGKQAERMASLRLALESKELEEKRKNSIETLVDIKHQIRKLEESYYALMLETAKKLEAVFAAYIKGVLWRRPLSDFLVPLVDMETKAVKMYQEWKLSENILNLIEEVTANENSKKD